MKASTQKKVAIFYPAFMGGGAESVGLWMLEALRKTYEVTLFTVTDINFEQLNAMYGTSLSRETVNVRYLFPAAFRPSCYFLIANNKDYRALMFHLLIRFFKKNRHQYDLVASAYNAMDFDGPGIQYIHWINVLEGKPLYQKISNFSAAQIQQNISIANSAFVAERANSHYGVQSRVIFPPVIADIPEIPWEQKENAFICSGRLVKSKQPHKVIQILKAVREQGFDVKLYMTGGGGGHTEWQYRRFLQQMVDANASWVKLYENLSYKDYIDVVAKCRYGIHFKQEPFGISIAEMVKANVITFVKSKGGQVEIVGKDNTEVFFDAQAEVVEKIARVLGDESLQRKLRYSLAEQKQLFSTEKFMAEIQAVFDGYFMETPAPVTEVSSL